MTEFLFWNFPSGLCTLFCQTCYLHFPSTLLKLSDSIYHHCPSFLFWTWAISCGSDLSLFFLHWGFLQFLTYKVSILPHSHFWECQLFYLRQSLHSFHTRVLWLLKCSVDSPSVIFSFICVFFPLYFSAYQTLYLQKNNKIWNLGHLHLN